jgi:hypothetical protein
MNLAIERRPAIGRLALVAVIAVLFACGGSSSGATTPAADNGGGGGTTTDTASQAPADDVATPPADDGSGGGTDAGSGGGTDSTDGTSIGDATKGTIKGEVTGDLSTTFDLPLGAPLAVFDVAGDDSAYLPYTDGVTTVFLTFADGQLLVQYAQEGTGITSGGEACTVNADDIDDGQVTGSFSCPNMMLIKGESIGTVDMTANFDAHR